VIVYSNTTPFIALSSIDRLDLLPQLFGEIYVAEAVIAECAAGGRIVVPDLRGLEWVVPVAEYLGLNITGTLGVLIKAKSLGLIPSFSAAAMDMQEQGIRYNKKLIARLASHIDEEKQ